jgi:hypothetical protein
MKAYGRREAAEGDRVLAWFGLTRSRRTPLVQQNAALCWRELDERLWQARSRRKYSCAGVVWRKAFLHDSQGAAQHAAQADAASGLKIGPFLEDGNRRARS